MSAPSDRPAPASKQAPPLPIGDVVAEKYKIESLLGEGGMGFVFAALHLQLGHRVAIKVLHSSALSDRDLIERFLREGRALARLQGEHIARVSDVGTLATGEPFLVMEFLEGRDLARELSARGPLPLEETVGFIAQACEALAEAHVRGIVHRDLKPANLFLSYKLDGDACIKVLDFGISKVTPSEDDALEQENITVTSTLVGTPKYMSPEQIQDSRSVDARTDIWGLGTIFYELLTRKRPFAAPSLALVCVKVLQEEVPPPSSIRADLPPEVDAIIARCLKKDPNNRFGSVAELVEALVPLGGPTVRTSAARVTRILAARGSGARLGADASGSLPGVGSPRTPSALRIENKEGATLAAATLLEATASKKRRSWVMAGGAGALLIVAVTVLLVALRSTSKSSQASTSPVTTTEPLPTVRAEPPATTTAAETAQPTASATAAPTATEEEATAKAHVVVRRSGGHHNGHAARPNSSAAAEGTGDVLEDRR